MPRFFHLPINYRKRKTRIALLIRIIGVCGILGFYIIFATINDDVVETNHINHRKLLSVSSPADYTEKEITAILKNFDPTLLTLFQDDLYYSTEPSATEITTNGNSENVKNRTTIRPRTPKGFHQKNCTRPAIMEFPRDGLTREQRRHGWLVVHLLVACYCFWLLAIVCDDYLVPTIEGMCSTLKIKEDVVGATFMAAATSSPELFINCVGTFITKGDIGVGTVVGSAVFNILAVPACCGLLGGQIVNLDWWPVSRDCLMYGVAVLSLIGVLADGRIMWYEGLSLVLAYLLYISVMYYNDIVAGKVRNMVRKWQKIKIRPFREVTEIAPLLTKCGKEHYNGDIEMQSTLETIIECKETEFADSPWEKASDTNLYAFILRWPITLLLWLTIPDCRKYPKLRGFTFFMCIVWIGVISYFVAFLITVLGDTISIPDSVMGLTFLAAGTSVPEAVSSVIVTNQGHGAMGISNSIGSNTFDILLCLGLPWFIKSYFLPAVPGHHWVHLNSSGLTYSAISLLSTLIGLYTAFSLNKFRLDWKVGLTCLLMYMTFLTVASLIELNVFFQVNLPVCDHH